jgi:hypothetical protein
MHFSRIISFQRNRSARVQCTAAILRLHEVTAAIKFPRWSSVLLVASSLLRGQRKGGCMANLSTQWRKFMLTLVPSIGVGFVGSLLIAIALVADWYIWKFRYWMSSGPLSPPPRGKNVIHVPSASGRELFVNCAWDQVGTEIPSVHQAERESPDIR